MPYKRIAAELGVSPSSAFAWTPDIELTAEQRANNLTGPLGPVSPELVRRRSLAWAEKCRERRRQAQEAGRARAREVDPLHLAGCMLFWAEGTQGRNVLCLANSDMSLSRFFRRFLGTCFELDDDRFVLRLNVYLGNGFDLRTIEDRWLSELELPRTCLRGHSINHLPTSSSGAKKNKLPYGVAALSVRRSTYLLQHIYGAIQEYGGFDEPAWLDGPPRKSRRLRPS